MSYGVVGLADLLVAPNESPTSHPGMGGFQRELRGARNVVRRAQMVQGT